MDTKETNELLDAVGGLTSELKAKSDDGDITLGEIIGLADNAKDIIDEAKDAETIKAELADLDPDEAKIITGKLIDIVWKDIIGTIQNKPKFKLA
jgi:ABC-type transporter Mla subunit MlaD